MQRAVRTPADAILRTVRDDRHFRCDRRGSLTGTTIHRATLHASFARKETAARCAQGGLRDVPPMFRDRGATSPSSPRRGRSVARIRRLGLAIRLCERLRDAGSRPGLHPSRHPAVGGALGRPSRSRFRRVARARARGVVRSKPRGPSRDGQQSDRSRRTLRGARRLVGARVGGRRRRPVARADSTHRWCPDSQTVLQKSPS